jgi:DNA-3-methyladenine glycosylase
MLNSTTKATPIATKTHPASPPLLLRPPRLGRCPQADRLPAGEAPTRWRATAAGVIVETEVNCQSELACQGHRRRTPSNETLFGELGRFFIYGIYGIHHCFKAA